MDIISQPAETAAAPAFTRAALDRNLTANTEPFRAAIESLDLTGLAVFDFGCGEGSLLRLLKNTKADVVYAFEVIPQSISRDILDWANDPMAKPRLVINPSQFKTGVKTAEGDLTGYDYEKILANHDKFAIVCNPPYFLFNRILSLTGQYLTNEDADMRAAGEKFAGALMVTSETRLQNHPGWLIREKLSGRDFVPPAAVDQYVVQTGFAGRFDPANIPVSTLACVPQRYVGINNRDNKTDPTDCYPEMWRQLNALARGPSGNA